MVVHTTHTRQFNAAIKRLQDVLDTEFGTLRPLQKGWALEIAAIRYIPQQAPWLPPRDEIQLDHDEYVEEMSIGGIPYNERD